MGQIYKLIFPNGKACIGMTVKTAEQRFCGHLQDARKGKSSCIVHQAWRKHGAPLLRVLLTVPNDKLAKAEIAAIRLHRTVVPNGYNLLSGGQLSPMHNPLVAAKVSRKLRGVPKTAEHIAKFSAAMQGRVISEQHRLKISCALKGVPKGADHVARVSAALKGKKKSAAHCAKLSLANIRRAADPAFIAKLKVVLNSPNVRSKKSLTAKRLWADSQFRAKILAALRSPETRKKVSMSQKLRKQKVIAI